MSDTPREFTLDAAATAKLLHWACDASVVLQGRPDSHDIGRARTNVNRIYNLLLKAREAVTTAPRCATVSRGGLYQCDLAAGHDGAHRTSVVFDTSESGRALPGGGEPTP